jgi:hypothetical protein
MDADPAARLVLDPNLAGNCWRTQSTEAEADPSFYDTFTFELTAPACELIASGPDQSSLSSSPVPVCASVNVLTPDSDRIPRAAVRRALGGRTVAATGNIIAEDNEQIVSNRVFSIHGVLAARAAARQM